MNATAESAPRHDPDLLNRWLDGLASPEEEAALVRSVEADPAATAALVDALLLQEELRPLLAPAGERPVLLRPRFAARKWLTAAALAACVAVAAVWGVRHFQPATDPGGIAVTESSDGRLKITRYSNGRHPAQRDWPAVPVATPNGPLVVKTYASGSSWPALEFWTEPPPADHSGMVWVFNPNQEQQTPDGKLTAFLRCYGVEMPQGAWASKPSKSDKFGLSPLNSIEVCTTATGHGRLSGLFGLATPYLDPKYRPTVRLQPWIYLGSKDEPLPAPFATERLARRQEFESLLLNAGMNRQKSCEATPEADWRFVLSALLTESGEPAPVVGSVRWAAGYSAARTRSELPLLQMDARTWRTGESTVRIMGVCGPPPELPAKASASAVVYDDSMSTHEWTESQHPEACPPLSPEETDLEFDLTLQEGEVAVLHAGELADGRPCIVLLEATISLRDFQHPDGVFWLDANKFEEAPYRRERITDKMYRR